MVSRVSRARVLAVALSAVAVVTLSVAAYRTVAARSAKASAFPDPASVQTLVDQNGGRFSFEALRGRTVVMNFIFTHCFSSCPMQTRALATVQRKVGQTLGDRVAFVSISLDPERDTPAELKRFATSLGADLSRWSFVTGAKNEIALLTQRFPVQARPLPAGQIDHRIAVFLFGRDQRLLQTYTGEPLDETRLITEIQTVDRMIN